MLKLNVENLTRTIQAYDGFQTVGRLLSANGMLTAELPTAVGELCRVELSSSRYALAETIGFDRGYAQIMPYHDAVGVTPNAKVVSLGRRLRVPVGSALLGRVVDGLGRPVDGQGALHATHWTDVHQPAPSAMERPRIDRALSTGQRAIDGLLTIGRGQRIALMAGSGVGKSTLLGEIAKGTAADVVVIALIGERGREVKPFLEDCLGSEALGKSVVVVATSDETPLMRVRSAQASVAIASEFRSRGADVLLLMDSITRLAMAQREIGLQLGEPPSARGYTPSVFQMIADVLEHLGCTPEGTISGILTVLVDGDDLDEPIADSVRATVDGHVCLDRALAERGHYPAIDIARSLSRVFRDVTPAEHQNAAAKLRQIMATHAEVADLIRLGAYQEGSSPQVDRARQIMPAIELFLRQSMDEYCTFEETANSLKMIADAWPF